MLTRPIVVIILQYMQILKHANIETNYNSVCQLNLTKKQKTY